MALEDKLRALKDGLSDLGTVAIAYSGGMDSTLLLHVANQVLGDDVVGVLCDTGLMSTSEMNDAILLANEIDAHLKIIGTRHLDAEDIMTNGVDRCYHCKLRMYSAIKEFAERERIDTILCGDNASDVEQDRPGRRARDELGVGAPLESVGITTDDVIELSMELGLRTAFKSKETCLASRIPFNTRLSRESLRRVARAEELMRNAGFIVVRVRDHNGMARIEVGKDELALAISCREELVQGMKHLGFQHVSLDLEGYRISGASH